MLGPAGGLVRGFFDGVDLGKVAFNNGGILWRGLRGLWADIKGLDFDPASDEGKDACAHAGDE